MRNITKYLAISIQVFNEGEPPVQLTRRNSNLNFLAIRALLVSIASCNIHPNKWKLASAEAICSPTFSHPSPAPLRERREAKLLVGIDYKRGKFFGARTAVCTQNRKRFPPWWERAGERAPRVKAVVNCARLPSFPRAAGFERRR